MTFLPAITGWLRDSRHMVTMYAQPYGRDGKRRRVTFALSREVLDEAKWQVGDRVIVSVGVGEHLGSFQISRVQRGRAGMRLAKTSNGGKLVRFHLVLPENLPGVCPAEMLDRYAFPNRMDWKVEDGALMVTLDAAAEAAGAGNVHTLRG